eukprot:gnl/TRDRNA2_/TRDRNA2_190496_c0_seq1.p1 gnl/TRDRNA2_/TRDRNA2_190496_c0~~gnl/TRDRNA2_/TRDRNA2_190496_c0_seq1.p1  ORF type:complete len:329 (+),score=20.92 gnl/TRDRNA2_/TRDRNA2_190496_c0_seq1:78-1064(+)
MTGLRYLVIILACEVVVSLPRNCDLFGSCHGGTGEEDDSSSLVRLASTAPNSSSSSHNNTSQVFQQSRASPVNRSRAAHNETREVVASYAAQRRTQAKVCFKFGNKLPTGTTNMGGHSAMPVNNAKTACIDEPDCIGFWRNQGDLEASWYPGHVWLKSLATGQSKLATTEAFGDSPVAAQMEVDAGMFACLPEGTCGDDKQWCCSRMRGSFPVSTLDVNAASCADGVTVDECKAACKHLSGTPYNCKGFWFRNSMASNNNGHCCLKTFPTGQTAWPDPASDEGWDTSIDPYETPLGFYHCGCDNECQEHCDGATCAICAIAPHWTFCQ